MTQSWPSIFFRAIPAFNVLMASRRSCRAGLFGRRSTAIPAYFLGGKFRGFPKSRSKVTRHLPSAPQIFSNSKSDDEHKFSPGTVATSWFARRKSSAAWLPKFSSNLNFKAIPRVESQHTVLWPFPPHRRYKPEHRLHIFLRRSHSGSVRPGMRPER